MEDNHDVEWDLKGRKFKVNPFIAALFFGGLFVFALGLGLMFFRTQSQPDVQIISGGDVKAASTVSEIMVHVDGEVVKPGVYKLAADSRVDSAVKAAGGMTAEADSAKVNLAAKLSDGQKVFIPSMLAQAISDNGKVISQPQNNLVSINNANAGELDKLPGVGPVTAQKIIDNRPYSSIEDLLSKKVVSNSVYEKVKDLVSL